MHRGAITRRRSQVSLSQYEQSFHSDCYPQKYAKNEKMGALRVATFPADLPRSIWNLEHLSMHDFCHNLSIRTDVIRFPRPRLLRFVR